VWYTKEDVAVFGDDPERHVAKMLPHSDFRLPCKGTGKPPYGTEWW